MVKETKNSSHLLVAIVAICAVVAMFGMVLAGSSNPSPYSLQQSDTQNLEANNAGNAVLADVPNNHLAYFSIGINQYSTPHGIEYNSFRASLSDAEWPFNEEFDYLKIECVTSEGVSMVREARKENHLSISDDALLGEAVTCTATVRDNGATYTQTLVADEELYATMELTRGTINANSFSGYFEMSNPSQYIKAYRYHNNHDLLEELNVRHLGEGSYYFESDRGITYDPTVHSILLRIDEHMDEPPRRGFKFAQVNSQVRHFANLEVLG